MCITCGMYKKGTQIANSVPISTLKFRKGLDPLVVLRYFYYAGVLFIGLKQWSTAIEYFKIAITLPSNCESIPLLLPVGGLSLKPTVAQHCQRWLSRATRRWSSSV